MASSHLSNFRSTAALAALVVLGTAAQAASQSKFEPLDIVSASGPHRFSVEVMRTEPEREHGLMNRRHLPDDQGMLFDFKAPQPVSMWMKNTYIPLDMIFIGQDGIVISVAENAVPLSEHIISSRGEALGVLEVNGGTAAKLGIKAGDAVHSAMFSK